MPFRPRRSVLPFFATWLVVGAGLLLLSGCPSEEGVKTYPVAREVEVPVAGQRVVGAIIPRDRETWFFKMTGPETAVSPQVEAFEKFLATVRFPEGKPIEWTKPDDWGEKQPNPSEMVPRYAILLVGPRQLELSVTKLGPLGNGAENTLLGNVNRWRRQIGLGPVAAADLGKTTREIKVGGQNATLVDATRPGSGGGGGDGPSKGNELKFKASDDWKKAPNDSFSQLKFTIARDGKTATVSFSQLTPQDLLPNVERWRAQVGLPPKVAAEDLPKLVSALELPLGKADYVDLSGSSRRLLGVLLHQKQGTWVFKLLGDAELVGSQKSAFEEFVKSVKLD